MRWGTSTTGRPSARRGELAIALLVLGIGTWVGIRAVQAFRSSGGTPQFYQSEFGPAVMFACGRGFQAPDSRDLPALAAFLSERADAFDCASLPPTIATAPPSPFQRTSAYLELAVALTWKLAGVSWSGLAILHGLLFGSVAALTYGVLRLALARGLALLALVPALMATPNVTLVPQLRDYAKGPFLLALILILGVLVVGVTERRSVLAWSAFAGVVFGLGLGFRIDLIVALLPTMITLALLVPASISTGSRLTAIGIFLGASLIFAAPALTRYAKGGNTGHVMLLGLATDFDRTLRIEPSVYEFVGQYNDTMAFSIINGYATRVADRHAGVDLATAEYDRAASSYLSEIAATFPGDCVTRIAAAIRVVPRYFLDSSLQPPAFVGSGMLRTAYWLRGGVAARLAPFAFLAVVAATAAIAVANLRAAWLVVVIMVGVAGASAIQFHERHFFFLQFVPWLAFGILAQAAARGRLLAAGSVGWRDVKRASVMAAIVAAAAGGAIWMSRAYQQRSARRLFERYESAPRTALPIEARDATPNRTLLTIGEWLQPLPRGADRVVTRFLAVQFRDAQCGGSSVDVTVRYQSVYADADLSETRSVPLRAAAAAQTEELVVAYDRADESIRFRGIEVASDRVRCVGGVSRVEGLDRAPLLLTTTLGAGWRTDRLYQTLR